ncbi:MAG: Ig-like domain-containing protein, partial [Candidatus Hydrogenedentales bacterium]
MKREFRNVIPAAAFFAALIAVCSGSVSAESNNGAMLRIEPLDARLVGPLARVQLVASVDAGDDLTREVKYESLTPAIIAVDATGLVTPLADGKGVIRILHGRQSVEVTCEVAEFATRQASFQHDVIPILSRAGCAGGACHAAQYGQGGLKLSLLGYAPEQDYNPLVREDIGRRISRVRPED